MLLALVVALTQAAPAQPDRPIRVWLGTQQPVAPGTEVRVLVRLATDGYLTVLRRTTDGRIEILFPAAPAHETFVPRGTYEVPGAGPGGAFAALEPPGTGLVLAALSRTPYRTREFAHHADWNPASFVPSWDGVDAEGALTDIVQRMLGDGYFAYDLVPYTVAQPAAAPQTPIAAAAGYDTCMGCVFPNVTVVVTPTVLGCDPFFLLCEDLFFFRQHRDVDRGPAEPPVSQQRVLGIPSAGRALPRAVASRAERPRFVRPGRPAAPPAVAPRRRIPDNVASRGAVPARAVPVLRGQPPPRAADVAVSPVTPRRRTVRLVMPATPPSPEPRARAPAGLVDVPTRNRTALVASAATAPVTPAARASAGAVVPSSRSIVARPNLVVQVQSGTIAAPTRTRAAAGGGQVRARGTTQAAAGPTSAESRATVRAGVAARKRQ